MTVSITTLIFSRDANRDNDCKCTSGKKQRMLSDRIPTRPFAKFRGSYRGHTWQWRVTPRQSIRSAIELRPFEKKKEEEEEERGNGEKRKEKKRKARYVDTSRVVSFYDRYRRTNGPRIETQRTAARDFCRVGEREGEKKEEEKGLLPTGRNMNSRLAYFFRDVRRKLWKIYVEMSFR